MADARKKVRSVCSMCVGLYCGRRLIELLRDAAATTTKSQKSKSKQLTSIAELFALAATTDVAAEDLRCQATKGQDCRYGPQKPKYDRDAMALWLGDECVHRYSDQATNETAILKAFQRRGWPRSVKNPLGKVQNKKYGAWLKTTVWELNHSQKPWWILFRSHPTSRSVSWELRLP
jgi:hypothetical protein